MKKLFDHRQFSKFLFLILACFLFPFFSKAQTDKPYKFLEKGKYGFKKNGVIIVPAKYQQVAGYFNEGFIAVKFNNKWGFIDETGKEVIPPKYDLVGNSELYGQIREGMASIKLNGKYGFVDKTGKEIVATRYDWVEEFSEGLAAVEFRSKWGFIDKTGKEVIPIKYQKVVSFDNTLGIVQLNNKWGAVDKTGRTAITIKYDKLEFAYQFNQTLNWLRAKLNGKYGFIDRNEVVVIPFVYDDYKINQMVITDDENDSSALVDPMGDFIDRIEMVKQNGKWGAIDFDGNAAIPIKYEDIQNEGDPNLVLKAWYKVKLNNKWGLVDTLGRELIAPQYPKWNFKYDTNAVKNVAASYQRTATKNNPVAKTQTSNETSSTTLTPPVTMKGEIDPSIVGTWKYHDIAANFNTYYVFRSDGTYDNWSDMLSKTVPEPDHKNFWRVNGDNIQLYFDASKQIAERKILKRNDPQSNKPALLIQWQSGAEEYRAYFPIESHALWPTNSSTTNVAKTNNVVTPVKLSDPPLKLNGTVDLSIVGLWKCNFNKIDYWLDFKADGTYGTYSATNPKVSKCFWRINGDYIETVCEGMKQMNHFLFRKVNDLKTGKPTITLDGTAYFPETDREMWKQ